jgi:hypothetical protein
MYGADAITVGEGVVPGARMIPNLPAERPETSTDLTFSDIVVINHP